jgi:hypothetical protein
MIKTAQHTRQSARPTLPYRRADLIAFLNQRITSHIEGGASYRNAVRLVVVETGLGGLEVRRLARYHPSAP